MSPPETPDRNSPLVSRTAASALALHQISSKIASKTFGAAFRLIVAELASFVPPGGYVAPFAFLPEALSLLREHDQERRLRSFEERLSDIEERASPLAPCEDYVATDRGRDHVVSILESALHATSDEQRVAIAHGYLSGCGLGRFEPNVVEIMDTTLRSLSAAHMQIFRWSIDQQLGMDLAERLRKVLKVDDVSSATGIPSAITQKLTHDLVRAGLLIDCGLNGLGGYWGVLDVGVSSFGRAFALYVEDARHFQGESLPAFESPLPDARPSP
jgi:hypothetical protein